MDLKAVKRRAFHSIRLLIIITPIVFYAWRIIIAHPSKDLWPAWVVAIFLLMAELWLLIVALTSCLKIDIFEKLMGIIERPHDNLF